MSKQHWADLLAYVSSLMLFYPVFKLFLLQFQYSALRKIAREGATDAIQAEAKKQSKRVKDFYYGFSLCDASWAGCAAVILVVSAYLKFS